MSVSTSPIVIQRARVCHAPGIHRLITYWTGRTPVLSKSLGQIYEEIREFAVALEGEQVVGAAALHIDWADLAEIRSVVVSADHQSHGIGRRLIDALIDEAREIGLQRVFCLTDKPEYFARFGFDVIDKAELPHKVWRDCVHCPIFTRCTEIAMGRAV